MSTERVPGTIYRRKGDGVIGPVELKCTGTWHDHRQSVLIIPEVGHGFDPNTNERIHISTNGKVLILDITGLPRLVIEIGQLAAQYCDQVRQVELPPEEWEPVDGQSEGDAK